MRKKRTLIGVIGTEIHVNEQRQILRGILTQAQAEHADAVVLSNIFNPLEPERAGCCENRIYDLLLSPDLNAVIMISESFVSETLRQNILGILKQRTDIPVILTGTRLPGFDFPRINTSDANDIEEITDHMIDVHGFRDIALLTGPLTLEVSRMRIEGYKHSLEKHGIPFDESKIHEGNFWYDSGAEFARKLIAGEIPMPEALVCENDYMAFGVLNAFEFAEINILDTLAVAGYEFVPERNLHTPLLTTYQRSRTELGKQAMQCVMRMLRGEPEMPFLPPKGRLIPGLTCTCDASRIRQHEELIAARLQRQYADWNLKSDLDRLLTECTNLDEFAYAMGEYLFMLRGVDDCFLCLSEDWQREQHSSDILLCRSVNHWADKTVFRIRRDDLASIPARSEHPAAFYLLPLCFHDRLFGYCVLQYNQPDSYDDVCRSWMKSVSNGLEFLRLKADVRYLLRCRTLSVSYDSMTGMFSADGLKSAYRLMQNAANSATVTAVMLRYCGDAQYAAGSEETAVNALIAAAQVLQQYQNGCICGRISEDTFLLLIPAETGHPDLFAHAVCADLPQDAGEFVCTAAEFPCNTEPDVLMQSLSALTETQAAAAEQRRLHPHFAMLREIRTEIRKQPERTHNLEDFAAAYAFHADYLNRKYKECFGQSFHQDCIFFRVLYAAHLLLHTALTISETAERCGYTESKYFIRQFAAVTGSPPKAFRNAVGGLLR